MRLFSVPVRLVLALQLLIVLPGLAGAAPDPDWPTFRGPDRSAVSKEKGLLQSWPESGPPLVWEAPGAGRGYASLAIAGNRIYTLGDAPSTAEDKDEYLTAFDRQTGKQLWKLKTGKPWTDGSPDWQSSRSTPTVDGDRVYVVTPHGVLVSADANGGSEIWPRT